MSQELLKDSQFNTSEQPESSVPHADNLHKSPVTVLPKQTSHNGSTDYFPDYTLATIHFPADVDNDIAVQFLNNVNAFVLATPGVKAQDNPYAEDYVFVGNKKEIDQFVDKFQTFEDVMKHPDLMPFYTHLIRKQRTIYRKIFNKKDSEQLLEIYKKSGINDNALSKNLPNIRDRINFLYSLCINPEGQYSSQKSSQIFQEFMLQHLKQIENIENSQEQATALAKFMNDLIFIDTKLRFKVRQFIQDLGKLKISNKLSMPIVLDDGTHCDLFDLNMSEPHKIMHSVDVSKINQSIDLSNITINGDFICSKAKSQIVMPKQINGLLDLSNYQFISSDTHIPNGATGVDLSYTIQKIEDLLHIVFPATVSEILVTRPMINAVLKDENQLRQFQKFAKKHPNIQIWDSKHALSLQSAIKSQKQPVQETKPKVQTAIPQKQIIPTISEKTSEWLAPDELKATLLANHPELMSVEDLDRRIQSARNLNSNVRKKTLQHNGKDVVCIHQEDIEKLFANLICVLEQDSKRPVKTPAQKPTAEPKKEQVQESSVAKKPRGIKLKKYIPRNIFKQIEKSCGDSLPLLVSVLERINSINYDYTLLENSDSTLVHTDKKGKLIPIQNTYYKRGKAATVSIENSDNRRIVLTINPQDKIIVAIAYFQDHANNKNQYLAYNKVALPFAAKGLLTDGITVVNTKLIESSDYYDVADLLVEYKQKIADNTNTEPTEQTKRRRPRIQRPNNATPIATTSSDTVECSLLDLIALEQKTHALIQKIENNIQQLKKENAPDSMLKKLQNVILKMGQDIR